MLQFVQTRYPALWPWIQLMRLDRPIGTMLLLWPTLWAVWIAGAGSPSLKIVLVFTLGVFSMRAAGCVINDFADRHIDGSVERTKGRPLATGALTSRDALMLFAGLVFLSFLLLLTLNWLTFWYAFGALFLAILYPFSKRFTYMPQFFLGAAFAWAIPMAFAAELGAVPLIAWVLYITKLVWTVAYDTQYAMCDREDDLRIGVKSTAVLFGDSDRHIIGGLQLMTLLLLGMVGLLANLHWPWFVGVAIAGGLFAYQQWLTKDRDRWLSFTAFLNNQWVGLVLFLSLLLNYTLY